MICHQIIDPLPAFDQKEAQNDLDQGQAFHDEVHRHHRQGGEAGQNKRQGDARHPKQTAVKQKCDSCLAPGAEGEIADVCKGMHGHHRRRHDQRLNGQRFDSIRSVIYLRKQRGEGRHDYSHRHTQHYRKGDQLRVRVHGPLQLSLPQQLADHNGDRGSHGQIGAEKQVGDSAGDVEGGDHFQSAHRVALVQSG